MSSKGLQLKRKLKKVPERRDIGYGNSDSFDSEWTAPTTGDNSLGKWLSSDDLRTN